jgi:intracellular sulfur oxidation DsrE/DsrF family protein
MMKNILILLACVFSFTVAETEFAEPKPAIDNPRQLVFSIPSGEINEINRILSTVNNVMKFYRPENTEVVIVAYGQGLKSLLKKGDANVRKRIEALMTYDVEFIACGNTMKTLHIDKKDLLDDIGFAVKTFTYYLQKIAILRYKIKRN